MQVSFGLARAFNVGFERSASEGECRRKACQMRRAIPGILLLHFLMADCDAPANLNSFVRVSSDGTRFEADGAPFYFAGANCYYLMVNTCYLVCVVAHQFQCVRRAEQAATLYSLCAKVI